MRKAVDVLLLLVVLCGGIMAWQTGRERRRLAGTYNRLARIAGDLSITDPSKVHVLALETGEPLHFAWRIYVPPNYTLHLTSGMGGQSSSWSSGSSEFIARVRFREGESGTLEVYSHVAGGSSAMGIGTPALAELLRGHWDRVAVEQSGRSGLTAIDPKKPELLLRLTLPDGLAKEAGKTLSSYEQENLVPVFYQLKLGRDMPKP
jgi:hypothetical protein